MCNLIRKFPFLILLFFVTTFLSCSKQYNCTSCVKDVGGVIKWSNEWSYFEQKNITHVSIYLDDELVVDNALVLEEYEQPYNPCTNSDWFYFEKQVFLSYEIEYSCLLKILDQNKNEIYADVVDLEIREGVYDCNVVFITLPD